MALEPKENEFDFPTFKREMELLEETAESSFEKGETSQRDDVPERFESSRDQLFGFSTWLGFGIFDREREEREKGENWRSDLRGEGRTKVSSRVKNFNEDAPDLLDDMERDIILELKDRVRLKPWGDRVDREERIRHEIAMVKSNIEKVRIMINCLNPNILKNQVAKPGSSYGFDFFYESNNWDRGRQAYKKANRLKVESRTTIELLEKMFHAYKSFTRSSAYKELREFNNSLLNHIEKCDSESIAKIAESSVAKVEPQSKGVVSKKNALRRQHNSQRDDPGEELERDQVEMKATLVECVFRIPQQPRFITALGYTPILVA